MVRCLLQEEVHLRSCGRKPRRRGRGLVRRGRNRVQKGSYLAATRAWKSRPRIGKKLTRSWSQWYDPNGWEHKDTGFRYVPTGKRAHRCRFGSPERDQYGQIVGPEEPEPPIASMPQPRNRLALELARSFAMVEQEVERYALATPAQRRRIDDEQDIYQRAYTDRDNYPPDGPVRFEPPVCQQPRVLQEYRPPPPLTLAQRQTERAIGRTPEEIIALERALAARRARRARRQA